MSNTVTLQFGSLTLLCRKCTREEVIHGGDRSDCELKAHKAGWVFDGTNMVCGKCSAYRGSQ